LCVLFLRLQGQPSTIRGGCQSADRAFSDEELLQICLGTEASLDLQDRLPRFSAADSNDEITGA
jgi:hypothetical protein